MQSGKCSGRGAWPTTSLMITTIRGPGLERPFNNKFKFLSLCLKSGVRARFGSRIALLLFCTVMLSSPWAQESKQQKTRNAEATDNSLALSLQFKYL